MTSPTQIDKAALTAPAALVEPYMKAFLESRTMPDNLRNAIAYSLLGDGKRMRPILTIRACEAVGGDASAALPPAAAIEMIHCFSLIHDDLPAMDDDDLRRGRPTLHKHTNEAMAILAGDALTSLAFEIIVEKVTPADRAVRIVTELARGTNDMISGQVYDTLPHWDPNTPDAQRLETIHLNKTGALLRASVRMGAIMGDADDAALDNLTTYANAIGLMFQVVDDLLDVTQTTEQLGKTAGKDVEQDKLTYPAVHGIEASQAEVERLRTEAHDALTSFGANAKHLHDLCDYLATRKK
ncbi:MAG: polyprenyl synthetase family protein [Phycisphaera sp.]|nr:polyprenyl synthetase family protein [Phycisphaera sp.]